MEGQVPFKVYAFLDDLGKPEVRRFGVERSCVTSFHYLNAKLQDVYPKLLRRAYTISWKDEEGDDVTISSDEEVITALEQLKEDVVKLYVHCKESEQANIQPDGKIFLSAVPDTASAAGDGPVHHFGVVCDGCDNSVQGFRYKCVTCPDYDLCSRCESAGLHPDHFMIRLVKSQVHPLLVKQAIKSSRHILKSAATVECPFKKHRHDRSSHKRSGEQRDRREGARPRAGWLDTFAAYMNEFANLAGDLDLPTDGPMARPSEPQPQPRAEASGGQTNDPKPQTSTEAPKPQSGTQTPVNGANSQTKTENIPSNSSLPPTVLPVIPLELDKVLAPEYYQQLMEFQKRLASFVPNLVPQNGQAQQPATPTEASVPTTSAEKEQKQEQKDQEQKKADDIDKSNVKLNDAASKDTSPDRADGWTMINKEQDLMDVGTTTLASAPLQPTPIGFNLPKEFQDRVVIDESKKMYPPLNAATAVLNPQEKREEAPPAPQAPTPRHPKAHIAAAVDSMLSMGFNNDGGWLTQLLDNYDGNISAVLDLLTPVAPKKK